MNMCSADVDCDLIPVARLGWKAYSLWHLQHSNHYERDTWAAGTGDHGRNRRGCSGCGAGGTGRCGYREPVRRWQHIPELANVSRPLRPVRYAAAATVTIRLVLKPFTRNAVIE